MGQNSEDFLRRAQEWVANPAIDEASRSEIREFLERDDKSELEERFYRDLTFGTGGMRALLGAGTNRINRYSVRRAGQAVAEEILSEGRGRPKLVIGGDSRHFSREFVRQSAGVFAANGIEVLVFEEPVPVPLVSFTIRHCRCAAGVMITASHNPPQYNGYKVFWSEGTQITSPQDENIIQRFKDLKDCSRHRYMDFEEGVAKGIIVPVAESTLESYFESVQGRSPDLELCRQRGGELSIVYTALHGTGTPFCLRALAQLGRFRALSVKEQEEPDGDFPTLASPNPENPEALKMAVELMRREKADIVLGTDPDTDRVGVALQREGKIIYPNGHQLGTLMLHYILSRLSEKDAIPPHSYFVKTIVTTPLQAVIAQAFGVRVENTLTGFKWICRRINAIEREHPERHFLFATEESFGHLHHPFVRDKDGVSSVALLAEVALWYKTRGMDLVDGLDEIYQNYGFSAEKLICLNYEGKAGAEKIDRLMEHFRRQIGSTLCGQRIEKVEDYQKGDENFAPSNVLGFLLEGGNLLYLRPSGTEPKIKFYIIVQGREGTLANKKSQANGLIDQLTAWIRDEVEKVL